MATELLAIGTAAAQSSDFSLTDGESARLFLVDNLGPRVPVDAVVKLQNKAVNGQYFDEAQLDVTMPSMLVMGPGTFRVLRVDAGVEVGVDRG